MLITHKVLFSRRDACTLLEPPGMAAIIPTVQVKTHGANDLIMPTELAGDTANT